MNDNSWESLLKKQQKKFHFAILLLTPVIALTIIIIINNRDFILEKSDKQPATAPVARPPITTEHQKVSELPHNSSLSHFSGKPLPSDDKNSRYPATEHHTASVSPPVEKQMPAHIKQSTLPADTKNQKPVIAGKPEPQAAVSTKKDKPLPDAEQPVFSIHPEPSKKIASKKEPAKESKKDPQQPGSDNHTISDAPRVKKQPESTKSTIQQPLRPQSPLPSTTKPGVPAPTLAQTNEHAVKEAIVKQTADIVFSEELPPITCQLQSRKDVVIKLTLELFFHDEDMRRSLRLQRDKIRLVVQQMIKPKELSEMNIALLEMQLLENVHRIFDPAVITSVKIKNIQIEKALSE